MFKMTDMENVYSSERRSAAPKVVIFRTAATSIVLVGTLTTISELLSFAYFRIVEIEQVLCFVWQGIIGMIAGILGLTYVYKPRLRGRWQLAKVVVVLAIITAISTIASIMFRIIGVVKFHRTKAGTEDKEKLVFLHFSFSLILEFALFALSVLLANITMTMYKLREIIDGIGIPTEDVEAETTSVDATARYINLHEEDL
eukprot:Seg362.7 transcript_id=Seg362.7/GoldUCD/mRNA.D3Y31 product="hypothetical protein" protein_id=Seg362.7/GoldUCD/D3Y31